MQQGEDVPEPGRAGSVSSSVEVSLNKLTTIPVTLLLSPGKKFCELLLKWALSSPRLTYLTFMFFD